MRLFFDIVVQQGSGKADHRVAHCPQPTSKSSVCFAKSYSTSAPDIYILIVMCLLKMFPDEYKFQI
jgi:hypothetical protein